MTKFYYRIKNAFEKKHELIETQKHIKINSTWKKIIKKEKFYPKMPKKSWAEKVFQAHRWAIKKILPTYL